MQASKQTNKQTALAYRFDHRALHRKRRVDRNLVLLTPLDPRRDQLLAVHGREGPDVRNKARRQHHVALLVDLVLLELLDGLAPAHSLGCKPADERIGSLELEPRIRRLLIQVVALLERRGVLRVQLGHAVEHLIAPHRALR